MKESKTIQAVPGSGVVWQAFRAAAPQTVPVFAGYLVLGMGYGIYVQSLGLPVWMPMLMGTVVYGGSLEFVLASLLLGTFSPLSAFLMALMIQARHLFYGISMLDKYKGTGWKKVFLIHLMCDESFAINYTAEVPAGIDKGWFLLWISLLNYSYWVTGSFLGSQFSTLLQFNLKGLGFIMTTLFAVIFLEQWLKEDQHVSASVGFAASLGCLAVFGAQRFMIPALVIILAVLTILRKPLQRQGGRGQF